MEKLTISGSVKPGTSPTGNKFGSLELANRLKKKKEAPSQNGSDTIDVDEFDAFDAFDIDGTEDDGFNIDINAQKDVWGKLNTEIMKLIDRLQRTQNEEEILAAAQELIAIFKENPDQKSHLIRNIGVIPIMEMLEGSNARVLHSILLVVNQVHTKYNAIFLFFYYYIIDY